MGSRRGRGTGHSFPRLLQKCLSFVLGAQLLFVAFPTQISHVARLGWEGNDVRRILRKKLQPPLRMPSAAERCWQGNTCLKRLCPGVPSNNPSTAATQEYGLAQPPHPSEPQLPFLNQENTQPFALIDCIQHACVCEKHKIILQVLGLPPRFDTFLLLRHPKVDLIEFNNSSNLNCLLSRDTYKTPK